MSATTPDANMPSTLPDPTTPTTPDSAAPATTNPSSSVGSSPPPSPEMPPDSILVRIHFDLPPHLPAHQRASWYSMNLTIPLMAPIAQLSIGVEAACGATIEMNKKMLEEEFYSKGKDLAGVARIVFEGDEERGEFVGRRVECVGDLFTATEVKKSGSLTVRVEMNVVEKEKKEMSGHRAAWRDGSGVGPSKGNGQVERRGTFPLTLQQQDVSSAIATTTQHSHSKMIQAIVLTNSGILGVPAREVGELLIGSIEDAVPPPYNLQEVPRSEYLHEADGRIPELPALTFSEYVPGNDNDTSAVADYLETNGKRIEVAVRLVSRIPNQQKGNRKLLLLPANVVLSLKHCPGQKKLICERLRGELKRFASSSFQDTPEQQQKKKILLSVLFNETENEKKEKSTPAWDFHLFVLPQEPTSSPPSSSSSTPSQEQHLFVQPDESTSPPSTPRQEHENEQNEKQVPRLYPFRGGSLSRYLHSSKVISENDTRLYMEAHIVPREVEEEEMLPSRKKKVIVVNFTTASSTSSGDDDGENGNDSLEETLRVVRSVLEEASFEVDSSSSTGENEKAVLGGQCDGLGGQSGGNSGIIGGSNESGHHDELD